MTPRTLQVYLGAIEIKTPLEILDVSYTRPTNGIGTLSLEISDPNATLDPDFDDVVTVKLDGTIRWKGVVSAIGRDYLGADSTSGTRHSLGAQDSNQKTQRQTIEDYTFPAQTWRARLVQLLGNPAVFDDLFGGYGITLGTDPVTGPSLDEIQVSGQTIEAFLNAHSTITGYLWRIDENDILSSWAVGTRTATPSLDETVEGEILAAPWQATRFGYRNRERVIYGPTGVLTVTDRWHGNGANRIFPLHYLRTGVLHVAHVEPGDLNYPVGVWGVDDIAHGGGLVWTYRASDDALVQDPSVGALTGADTLTNIYDAQFPNKVLVEDGGEIIAHGPWTRTDRREAILDYESATTWGLGRIAESLPKPRTPQVRTLVQGLNPGETIDANLPSIDIDQVCLMRSIRTDFEPTADDKVIEISTIDLIAASVCGRSLEQVWLQMIAGGGGGGGGGISGGGGGGGGGTTSRNTIDLGGSIALGVSATGWQPIPEWKPRILHSSDYPGGIATGHVWRATEEAGDPVQVRVTYWNGATWVQAGIGVAYAGTDLEDPVCHEVIDVTVADGRQHRGEINHGSATNNARAHGYIE
jgi:hypothetical protein